MPQHTPAHRAQNSVTDGATGFQGFGTGGLGRFRGDDRSTAFALDNLPFNLLERFDELATSGKFGPGGVSRITNEAVQGAQRSASLQRRLRRKGLIQRGGVGRRLGPNSGQIDTFLANQFQAPTDAALAQFSAGTRTQLEREQATSRLSGLEGIAAVMDFLRQRFDADAAQQGGGLLDILGPALQVGGALLGGPAGAAAGAAASGAVGSSTASQSNTPSQFNSRNSLRGREFGSGPLLG